jgi:hypothetical protein
MYAEITLSERMDAFLEAHVRACAALGGRVPRRILYDNCRTVILQRVGGAVRLHPRLIELADHYRFQPAVCPPRKPWHKGRVESGIGYLRKSFQRGRGAIVDLERERGDLARCVEEVANARVHRVTRRRPRELFDQAESAALLPIADRPFDAAHLEVSASADKYYRVAFDGNRYSVPYQLAHARGLVLRATTTQVEVYRGAELVARHQRSYGRGQDSLDPAHDRGLRERSRRGHRDTLLARFIAVLGPEAESYARGLCREHVQAARHLRRVLALADRFGVAQVRAALAHAQRFRAYGADYVENIAIQERRRSALGQVEPLRPQLLDPALGAVELPDPDLDRFHHLLTRGEDHGEVAEDQRQPSVPAGVERASEDDRPARAPAAEPRLPRPDQDRDDLPRPPRAGREGEPQPPRAAGCGDGR